MTDDVEERRGIRLDDLTVSVTFPGLRIDRNGREDLGQYVQELTVEVSGYDSDQDSHVKLGCVECLLFDPITADCDDSSLWPEADYESSACEFYEFLFLTHDWIRRGLLQKIPPWSDDEEEDDGDEDEITEVCNVLCVSLGWWACRPDVLGHVIGRLKRLLRFDFVCVDTTYIHESSSRKRGTRSAKPMRLPEPFRKVVWGETTNPDHLIDDEARRRFFWVAALFGDEREYIRWVDDDAPVLPLKVVS